MLLLLLHYALQTAIALDVTSCLSGVEGQLERISGSIMQTNTGTGRLAMDKPNLQCAPKARDFTVPATQASGQTSPAYRIFTNNTR